MDIFSMGKIDEIISSGEINYLFPFPKKETVYFHPPKNKWFIFRGNCLVYFRPQVLEVAAKLVFCGLTS